MRTLELFCGTKSFSKVAEELGHDTYTIDFNPEFKPDMCMDIGKVSVLDLWKLDKPKVIWASPPCQGFSVASIGKMWNKDHTPKHPTAVLGLNLLHKTLSIIDYLKPKYWFIENPRGKMRRMECLKDMHRKTVTYCQYGDTRMKPTDIWTNLEEWEPAPTCKNGDPCHVRAPRGSKTGTQGLKAVKDRSRIPPKLFQEIFEVIG